MWNQRQNLRHLCEPLGGTDGLIETVGFKKTTQKCVVKNKRSGHFDNDKYIDANSLTI